MSYISAGMIYGTIKKLFNIRNNESEWEIICEKAIHDKNQATYFCLTKEVTLKSKVKVFLLFDLPRQGTSTLNNAEAIFKRKLFKTSFMKKLLGGLPNKAYQIRNLVDQNHKNQQIFKLEFTKLQGKISVDFIQCSQVEIIEIVQIANAALAELIKNFEHEKILPSNIPRYPKVNKLLKAMFSEPNKKRILSTLPAYQEFCATLNLPYKIREM